MKKIERPEQISGYDMRWKPASAPFRKESWNVRKCPMRETLRVMELMDSLREEWGVRFPFEWTVPGVFRDCPGSFRLSRDPSGESGPA